MTRVLDLTRRLLDRLHAGETALLAIPLICLVSVPKRMIDYGIFRALGEEMVRTHGLADADVFSHTVAGRPFVNGAWLSELVFVAWDRLGGMGATFILHALLVTATLALVYAYARRRGASTGAAVLAVVVGAALFADNLMLRPQTNVLPLFVAAHWIGAEARGRWWAVPAMAAISVAWTNLHGSFALMIPLLGALAADPVLARDLRGTLWAGALLVTAAVFTLVNPYGIHLWGFVFENMTAAQTGMIEWAAPRVTSVWFWRIVVVTGLTGFLLAWRKPRPRASDVLLVAGLAFASFRTLRMAVWFGLAVIPILAPRLALVWPTRRASPRARLLHQVASGALIALALVALVRVPRRAPLTEWVDDEVPLALFDAVRERRPEGARLFNPQEWGSPLAWLLGPKWPVFVDIRAWVYPAEVWQDYGRVAAAEPGWDATLDDRAVEVVLLDLPRMAGLDAALAGHDGWVLSARTERGALYLRVSAQVP